MSFGFPGTFDKRPLYMLEKGLGSIRRYFGLKIHEKNFESYFCE